MEMFRELPHEIVPAEDLEKLARDKSETLHTFFSFVFGTELAVI